MLVLSRKPGEKILIGEDVVVTALALRPNDGRMILGIDAPKSIEVDREEVRERKRTEK